MNTLKIALQPTIELTDEQFFQICQSNRDLRFEKTASGELIVMPPTGGETGNRNGRLTQQLFNWSDTNEDGIAFDSSTGFKLPNGADRSPDAAWIRKERWDALSPEDKMRFVPLCPDFVVEILSPSDRLETLQAKMQEYIDNGARLGWLLNRKLRRVEIYRPGKEPEILDGVDTVSGEEVLPGFVLRLQWIW
jgi:Uma2 family endonuclease